MSALLVVGAGGHGVVVADAAQASRQWSSIGFHDDRWPEVDHVLGWPVHGSVQALREQLRSGTAATVAVIVAIGDNRRRLTLGRELAALGAHLTTVIHPSAVVSASARIGAGSVVMAGAVINPRARLGEAAIVNTRASVDHDANIGDGVHLCPGSTLAGQVSVHDLAWVGIGSSVIQGLTIGAGAVVGAGAAVIRNVERGSTVAGCPAKEIRRESC